MQIPSLLEAHVPAKRVRLLAKTKGQAYVKLCKKKFAEPCTDYVKFDAVKNARKAVTVCASCWASGSRVAGQTYGLECLFFGWSRILFFAPPNPPVPLPSVLSPSSSFPTNPSSLLGWVPWGPIYPPGWCPGVRFIPRGWPRLT